MTLLKRLRGETGGRRSRSERCKVCTADCVQHGTSCIGLTLREHCRLRKCVCDAIGQENRRGGSMDFVLRLGDARQMEELIGLHLQGYHIRILGNNVLHQRFVVILKVLGRSSCILWICVRKKKKNKEHKTYSKKP